MDFAIVATLLAAKIAFFGPVSPAVAWRKSPPLVAATGVKHHLETDPAPAPMRKNHGNGKVNEAINRRSIGNDDRWNAVPGTPGMDYPDHAVIPATSFTCLDKRPGGYYADVETGCQVFHVCNIGGLKSSFLCPTGSIFNQRYFVCDWWYSFDCDEAPRHYHDESFESTSGIPESSSIRTKNFTSTPIVVLSHSADLSMIGKSLDHEVHPDEQNPSNEINGIGNRESVSKSSVVESSEAKNEEYTDRAYSNESRPANESHDDVTIQARDGKVPRGFSRYQDDDRETRITTNFDRHSHELGNDLASYVNYAYFEA